MLAPTPPMGWNSWNTFGHEINEQVVRETADAFVESGLKDAGYAYVVIDDLWEADERDADGRLTWDTEKFPAGIPALAEYVHSQGLKFGIYSCAGTHTCAAKPASFGYEQVDAQTFAEWGVDFLKYDCCFHPPHADVPMSYRRMGHALRNSGRDILFSLCEWGHTDPWKWARSVGGHMWRTTGDINDSWESILEIGFRKQRSLHSYAGPNGWNDPDMLVVGMYGKGNVARTGCHDGEYLSHFALWCLLAAPLMIGCDVRHMNEATRRILTHAGLIAINQDPLGAQAICLGHHRQVEVWHKPLADGGVAVGFFNLHDSGTQRKTPVAFESIGLATDRAYAVSDVWTGEPLGEHRHAFNAGEIEPHHCQVVKIAPAG